MTPRHQPAFGPTLPLLDQLPAAWADAARNRRVVLAAAKTIMVDEGVDALYMEALAEAQYRQLATERVGQTWPACADSG